MVRPYVAFGCIVMRANLLPRSKKVVRLFGLAVDSAYLRQIVAGLATAMLVGAIGIGIEYVRIGHLERLALARERLLTAQSAQRALAKRLAFDVGRYQEFEREAQTFRSSGALAAVAVARIGNTVAPAAWLDALEHDPSGYALSGATRSLESLTQTIHSLGDAEPHSTASLLSIDNHASGHDGVRFRARLAPLASPGATPGAVR